MTLREFDPAFSADLRDELVARADAAAAPGATVTRPPLARPQVWITALTAVALIAATLGVLHLTGGATAPATHGTRTSRAQLVDPLTEITDRSSQMYVGDAPTQILHARADRSRTFALAVPARVASVRFYLVCTPGKTYSLRTSTQSSGGCSGSIGGYEEVPTDELPATVRVDVAAGVEYVLLVIPAPAETQAPQAPIQLPPLPYPTGVAATDRPLIGHERSTTSSRVTGAMTRTAHGLFVVTTCRGSGTLVISTQDGFTSGSADDAPDPHVCGSTEPLTTTYGDSEEGGMEHYGHMRYAIQPVGSITWTVSFYDAR